MNVKNIKTEELIPYDNNPRFNAGAVDKVAESIKEFGFKVPIIVDSKNVIVTGHTRLMAANKLGMEEVPVIVADDLTDGQIKAFRIADNRVAEFSEWDFEKLEVELAGLADSDFNLDALDFDFDDVENDDDDVTDGAYDEVDSGSLMRRFVIPPFSVLDTRQGYWRQRRNSWLAITGNLSETRDGEYGRVSTTGSGENLYGNINSGTSNFDPVLAEIMLKWFNVPGGKVLDPFGGEQTKGIVSGELGYEYNGMEIRQEQVDLNSRLTEKYDGVDYYTGDSNNISKVITDRDFDFCFTSPPYYDLEVYSKDDMSALGTYEEFMQQYKNIFQQCYDMLKENRFLVVKVAEIRDKNTGEYRNFVGDNITIMKEVGFKYYNEITLVNAIGTAPIRANNSMRNRKIVKVHQNVLVFYKGDIDKIQDDFPAEAYDEDDELFAAFKEDDTDE